MKIIKGLWTRLVIFRMVMKDGRIPFWSKFLLGIALVYFLVPFDLISDFIPLLGQLDDITIISILVTLAIKLIPAQLIEKYRKDI